jgi:hypothetical protein
MSFFAQADLMATMTDYLIAAALALIDQLFEPGWPVIDVIIGCHDKGIRERIKGGDYFSKGPQVLRAPNVQTQITQLQDRIWELGDILIAQPKHNMIGANALKQQAVECFLENWKPFVKAG